MYAAAILGAGFDDLETLASIEDGDMEDIGIPAHHAALLRRKLRELEGRGAQEPDASHPVAAFLCKAGLAQYTRVLLASGFDEMETLMLIDDQDLKDLGIPRGYAVKLHRALREEQAPRQAAQAPAAFARAAASMRPNSFLPGDQRVARAVAHAAASIAPMPTEEEFSNVVASWKIIEGVGVNTVAGVLIKHTFTLAPEAIAIVPPEVRARYQEWTEDAEEAEGQEIWHSLGLRRIFAKILNAVGCSVAGLHDMGKLAPILVKLGARHYHYGVRERQLQVVGQALDMTLRDLLKENYTFDVRAAWCTVYACISSIMVEGMAEEMDTVEGIPQNAQCANDGALMRSMIFKDTGFGRSMSECESTCSSASDRDRTDAETTEVEGEPQVPTTPNASTEDEGQSPSEETPRSSAKE